MLRSVPYVTATLSSRIAKQVDLKLRSLSSKAGSPGSPLDDDQQVARQWLANYNTNTIPRNICDKSFSRSSGPGGQNVNK